MENYMALTNDPSHLHISAEEILKMLNGRTNLAFVSRSLKYLHQNIMNRTAFLDELYSADVLNTKARLNVMSLGITTIEQIPLCTACEKKHVRLLKKEKEFSTTCSTKCERKLAAEKTVETWGEKGCPLSDPSIRELGKEKAHSPEARKKREETCMEKYGTKNPARAEHIRKKMADSQRKLYAERGGEIIASRMDTCRLRYGEDHHMRVGTIKQSIRERYYKKTGYTHFSRNPETKKKSRETCLQKYNVDNVGKHPRFIEKQKQTWNNKTEVEMQCIQSDRQRTCMQVYGVKNPSAHQKFKDAKITTSMENWGVPYPTMNGEISSKVSEGNLIARKVNGTEIVQKSKETKLRKYNSTAYNLDPEAYRILSDKNKLQEIYSTHGGSTGSEIIGCNHTTFYRYMNKHGIEIDENSGTSFAEREIGDILESFGFEIRKNSRDVVSGELDIYIPSHKLAIEYNGIFWHSTKFNKKTRYHLNKTKECEALGIQLIHIFEDEWLNNREQILNKIKHILGVSDQPRVYARKCAVREINNKDVKDFYNKNHLQGHVNSSKVYGLFHNDELVAAMSFKHTGKYLELNRFATSCIVVGGFSKILKTFIKENEDIHHIVSFADRRYSTGKMYETNGFELTKVTPPDYQYVVGKDRVRKQHFRHERYLKELPNYDPKLSERENTENHGIYRVYDCGLLKYEWRRS